MRYGSRWGSDACSSRDQPCAVGRLMEINGESSGMKLLIVSFDSYILTISRVNRQLLRQVKTPIILLSHARSHSHAMGNDNKAPTANNAMRPHDDKMIV